MAINLEELYGKLYPRYGVKLCTKSCFEKSINWIHILEDIEFVSMLKGGELILNSGYKSEEWLKKYIGLLNLANAGGLIIALRAGQTFTEEVIDYCNRIEFPLFSATWKTSYMDIIHLISSLLLKHEHREANKITALKNAIHHPQNAETYQGYFYDISLSKNPEYFITILGPKTCGSDTGGISADKLEKSLRHAISGGIIYKEKETLVILAASCKKHEIRQQFLEIREKTAIYVQALVSPYIIHATYTILIILHARHTGWQKPVSGTVWITMGSASTNSCQMSKTLPSILHLWMKLWVHFFGTMKKIRPIMPGY